MGKLISIVGTSGVGKTTLVQALAKAYPFQTAYEQHAERPFQALFKEESRFALANQIDYFLACAEQEKQLRLSPRIGLMDGGLDQNLYAFTRLFQSRGLLSEAEFDLCRRVYDLIREVQPPPELFVRLCADEETVAHRLSTRDRINIARAQDTTLFNSFLDEWLASIPLNQVLEIDVTHETTGYSRSVQLILEKISEISR